MTNDPIFDVENEEIFSTSMWLFLADGICICKPRNEKPEKGGRKPGSPEFAGVCRSIPRSILAPEHLAKTLARVENRSQLVK